MDLKMYTRWFYFLCQTLRVQQFLCLMLWKIPFFFFFFNSFSSFTLSTSDARLAVISPLETVQIVPGGAQSSIKQKVNIWKDFKYIILARGLGGILQWKISFSSRSLWKQLLTHCVDLGTLDGQRTSIKPSWFYFLHLVLLLLQLLHYFPP